MKAATLCTQLTGMLLQYLFGILPKLYLNKIITDLEILKTLGFGAYPKTKIIHPKKINNNS